MSEVNDQFPDDIPIVHAYLPAVAGTYFLNSDDTPSDELDLENTYRKYCHLVVGWAVVGDEKFVHPITQWGIQIDGVPKKGDWSAIIRPDGYIEHGEENYATIHEFVAALRQLEHWNPEDWQPENAE